jgi:hypothetical protein
MRLELFFIEPESTSWVFLEIWRFCFFITTEKWWSHGNEFVIGVRFGKKVYERRFKNE